MGRLTDSLNEAIDELDAIEAGIERMDALGEKLRDNTVEVAQSALKVGYMTGQQAVGSEVNAAAPALPAIESLQAELKQLRSSQSSLRTANDLYRLQRELVKRYLQQADVDSEVVAQVGKIYQLKGIRSAPSLAERLLDLDRSQILKFLRKAATYSKHLLD